MHVMAADPTFLQLWQLGVSSYLLKLLHPHAAQGGGLQCILDIVKLVTNGA